MSATNADLKKQVDRMIAFMEQEGKEREDEILSKAEEDYHIMIADMVYAGRLKVKELYEKKEAAVKKQQIVDITQGNKNMFAFEVFDRWKTKYTA